MHTLTNPTQPLRNNGKRTKNHSITSTRNLNQWQIVTGAINNTQSTQKATKDRTGGSEKGRENHRRTINHSFQSYTPHLPRTKTLIHWPPPVANAYSGAPLPTTTIWHINLTLSVCRPPPWKAVEVEGRMGMALPCVPNTHTPLPVLLRVEILG